MAVVTSKPILATGASKPSSRISPMRSIPLIKISGKLPMASTSRNKNSRDKRCTIIIEDRLLITN